MTIVAISYTKRDVWLQQMLPRFVERGQNALENMSSSEARGYLETQVHFRDQPEAESVVTTPLLPTRIGVTTESPPYPSTPIR